MQDEGTWGKYFHAVWERTDLTAGAKVVYVELRDHLGDNEHAWPSQNRLAKRCGMHVASVNRAINELREKGLILIEDSRRTFRYSFPNVLEARTFAKREHSRSANANRSKSTNPIILEARAQPDSLNQTNEPDLLPPVPAGKRPVRQKAPRRPRPNDPIWDAVVELWYPEGVATGQQSGVGAIVRDLAELGATPDEIRARRARWIERYPTMADTARAVLKHWSDLNEERHQSWRRGKADADQPASISRIRAPAGKYDNVGKRPRDRPALPTAPPVPGEHDAAPARPAEPTPREGPDRQATG